MKGHFSDHNISFELIGTGHINDPMYSQSNTDWDENIGRKYLINGSTCRSRFTTGQANRMHAYLSHESCLDILVLDEVMREDAIYAASEEIMVMASIGGWSDVTLTAGDAVEFYPGSAQVAYSPQLFIWWLEAIR